MPGGGRGVWTGAPPSCCWPPSAQVGVAVTLISDTAPLHRSGQLRAGAGAAVWAAGHPLPAGVGAPAAGAGAGPHPRPGPLPHRQTLQVDTVLTRLDKSLRGWLCPPRSRVLQLAGEHSLALYCLHDPVLKLLLFRAGLDQVGCDWWRAAVLTSDWSGAGVHAAAGRRPHPGQQPRHLRPGGGPHLQSSQQGRSGGGRQAARWREGVK